MIKIIVNPYLLILLFFLSNIVIKSQTPSKTSCTLRFLDDDRCDSLCVITKYIKNFNETKLNKTKTITEEEMWYYRGKKQTKIILEEYDTSGVLKHMKEMKGKKIIHEFNLICYNLSKKTAFYHFTIFYNNKPKMPDTIKVNISDYIVGNIPSEKVKEKSIIAEKINSLKSSLKGEDTIKAKNWSMVSQKVVGPNGLNRYDYFFRDDSVGYWRTKTYVKMGNNAEWYSFIIMRYNTFSKMEEITNYDPHYSQDNVFLGYLASSKEIQYKLNDGCTAIEDQYFYNNQTYYEKPYSTLKTIYNTGYYEAIEIVNFNKVETRTKIKTDFYK